MSINYKKKFSILLMLLFLGSTFISRSNDINANYRIESNYSSNDKVKITFIAQTPEIIDHLEIQILYNVDAYDYKSYNMIQDDNDPLIFRITLEFQRGRLLRYRYGLEWEEWEYLSTSNPSFRGLLIPDTDEEINDVIIGFVNQENSFSPSLEEQVNITGRIVEKDSEFPVEHGFILIGGVMAPITSNGTYYLENVLVGEQRAVIFPYTHKPKMFNINITQNGNSHPSEIILDPIATNPSDLIRLTFLTKAPEDTPEDRLKIVGDHPLFGYIFPHMRSRYVSMQHIKDGWFMNTIETYSHVPINYYYTLGSYTSNFEVDDDVVPIIRTVVPKDDSVVVDEISCFKAHYHSTMKFRVTVPEYTPTDPGLYLWHSNSFIPMDQINETLWETTIDFPTDWDYDYYYSVGTYTHAIREHGYNSTSPRLVKVDDKTFYDTVSSWDYIEHLTAETTEDFVNVTLSVTIPFYTPDDDLYLVGDLFDSWEDPQGKLLTQSDGHSWNISLLVSPNEPITISLTRGSWDSLATKNITINPSYNGQIIYQYIDGWEDIENPMNERESLITGVMPIDYWSPGMKSYLEPAFKRFTALGGKWIQYSPIWNYDRLKPTSFLSSRSGVFTPDDDLLYIVKTAQKYGLRVGLQLQSNTEMTPDGDQWDNMTEEETSIILKDLRRFYTHYAELSQELGVEFLAFARMGRFNDTIYDAFMMEFIPEIREIYDGMLTTHNGWTKYYDYYELLDFIGLIFWENVLEDNNDPSVDELTSAFIDVLNERYYNIYDTYNVPILFTQVAYAAGLGANYRRDYKSHYEGVTEAFRPDIQGRIYEAFMRAISNMSWIEGAFSFGWSYWQFDFADYCIANKPAESVLIKWNQMFPYTKGIDISSLNQVNVLLTDFQLNLKDSTYDEYRIKTSTGEWSEWMDYTTIINLSSVLGITEEGTYTLWLQGRKTNGNAESNPTPVVVTIDLGAPKVHLEPPIQEFELPYERQYMIIDESDGSLLQWIFLDQTDITIEVQFEGPNSWDISLDSNTLFIPIELFEEGNWVAHFTVKDQLDNTLEFQHQFEIVIIDDIPPEISDIEYLPNEPTEEDQITIKATVTDNIEVESVILSYRIDGGEWENITMTHTTGDMYSVVTGPFDTDATILFKIYAYDTSGNAVESQIISFDIQSDTDESNDLDDKERSERGSFISPIFIGLSIVIMSLILYVFDIKRKNG